MAHADSGGETGMSFPLNHRDLQRAAERITHVVVRTPLVPCPSVGAQLGCRVFLKLENLQRTGSYKIRGAFNKLATLDGGVRARGVVAASAGNHAQGVALAAAIHGVAGRSRIVMPVSSSSLKQRKTQHYGVAIELFGGSVDEARLRAAAIARDTKRTLIEPFDDWDIIAGHASVGLEILADLPQTDVIVTPVGGGGLLAGLLLSTQATTRRVRVLGVQARRSAGLLRGLALGRPVQLPRPSTIADGIRVGLVGEKPLGVAAHFHASGRLEVTSVRDSEIAGAVRELASLGWVVEPAGAAALAAKRAVSALCAAKRASKPAVVVFVVTGSNVDSQEYGRMLERRLAEEDFAGRGVCA
jgi:threonine dehydratase